MARQRITVDSAYESHFTVTLENFLISGDVGDSDSMFLTVELVDQLAEMLVTARKTKGKGRLSYETQR